MSVVIPDQGGIGIAFSIAGLALAPISSYLYRSYSRTLDLAQILFIFSSLFSITSTTFSNNLGYSWLSFMPSFLSYCTTGDFSCNYGYLLSPAVCWLGVAILMIIVIKLISIKKHNAKYQPFYNFFKGFLRWTLGPLVYFATDTIVTSVQANTLNNNFLVGVIVAAFYLVIIHVELIGYKCTQTQEQNPWKKWIQYFSHLKIIVVMVLLVIYNRISSFAQYFIYGPLLLYDLAYLIKYRFTFKIFQRIFFFISEAIVITLYSIFIFNNSYISNYSLDFFGLAAVLFFQILLFLVKLYSYCKNNGQDGEGAVNPEKSEDDRKDSPKKKPVNGFDVPEMSYEDLNASNSSPRRNGSERKRR